MLGTTSWHGKYDPIHGWKVFEGINADFLAAEQLGGKL